jgi:hypothetical protein
MDIPYSGTIKVKDQTELIAHFSHADYLFLWENRATLVIVGVFQSHHLGFRAVDVPGADQLSDRFGGYHPVFGGYQIHQKLGVQHGRAAFVIYQVAFPLTQQFPARPALDVQSNLVGHSARRNVKRSLASEKSGDVAFQFFHSRVITENIIANFGRSHRLPHGRRRPGDGI